MVKMTHTNGKTSEFPTGTSVELSAANPTVVLVFGPNGVVVGGASLHVLMSWSVEQA